MKKLYKWWLANTTYRPVWRVTYKDGKTTYPLSWNEAHGLAEYFDGKLWIDYTL